MACLSVSGIPIGTRYLCLKMSILSIIPHIPTEEQWINMLIVEIGMDSTTKMYNRTYFLLNLIDY